MTFFASYLKDAKVEKLRKKEVEAGMVKKSVAGAFIFALIAGGIFLNLKQANAVMPLGAGSSVGGDISQKGSVSSALQIQVSDYVLGDENAPVKVIEYMSMTCGHCAQFHEETFPQIKEEYIKTGKVQFIVREMPWDNLAFAASKVARCAPADQYHQFVSAFMQTQKNWVRSPDPLASIKQVARLGGMSGEEVEQCLKDEAVHRIVLRNKQTGRKTLNVKSTPTFFVNGQRLEGARQMREFRALIDAELQKQEN